MHILEVESDIRTTFLVFAEIDFLSKRTISKIIQLIHNISLSHTHISSHIIEKCKLLAQLQIEVAKGNELNGTELSNTLFPFQYNNSTQEPTHTGKKAIHLTIRFHPLPLLPFPFGWDCSCRTDTHGKIFK